MLHWIRKIVYKYRLQYWERMEVIDRANTEIDKILFKKNVKLYSQSVRWSGKL